MGAFAIGDAAGAALALPSLFNAAEALGGGLFGALSLSVLAEAQAANGDLLASKTIAESESLGRSGALYGLAEIQRRKGIILRRLRPGDSAAAEAALARAGNGARPECALLGAALRARDLARLLIEQGERQQAADLLAPIHAGFTEGLDSPDLIEVRGTACTAQIQWLALLPAKPPLPARRCDPRFL